MTTSLEQAERQLNEIVQLKGEYPSLSLATPVLFERLQACVAAERAPASAAAKRLCFTVDLADACAVLAQLRLRVTLPHNYPDAACELAAEHSGGGGGGGGGGGSGAAAAAAAAAAAPCSSEALAACAAKLSSYVASFAGNECVGLALEYAAEQGAALLAAGGGGGAGAGAAAAAEGTTCFVLRFNHLLKGAEHKKEKAMMDAAKKGRRQGAVLWGTPGVVLLTDCGGADAQEYGQECRALGKKPDGPAQFLFPAEGLEAAGVGGLAQQKRGGRLAELDTAGLRVAAGGDEALLKQVLGIS